MLALFVALAANFAAGQDAIGGVSFGAGAVANLSDGPMFPIDVDSKDRSMDAAYAMDDIAYLKGQLDPDDRTLDPLVLFACNLNTPHRDPTHISRPLHQCHAREPVE